MVSVCRLRISPLSLYSDDGQRRGRLPKFRNMVGKLASTESRRLSRNWLVGLVVSIVLFPPSGLAALVLGLMVNRLMIRRGAEPNAALKVAITAGVITYAVVSALIFVFFWPDSLMLTDSKPTMTDNLFPTKP